MGSKLLCDDCNNKAICRVREIKDSVYPGTIICVSACAHYIGQSAVSPSAPAPVVPTAFKRDQRSLGELANIGERIKKITRENAGNTKGEESTSFRCSVCGKEFPAEEAVEEVLSGRLVCQECYDEL